MSNHKVKKYEKQNKFSKYPFYVTRQYLKGTEQDKPKKIFGKRNNCQLFNNINGIH